MSTSNDYPVPLKHRSGPSSCNQRAWMANQQASMCNQQASMDSQRTSMGNQGPSMGNQSAPINKSMDTDVESPNADQESADLVADQSASQNWSPTPPTESKCPGQLLARYFATFSRKGVDEHKECPQVMTQGGRVEHDSAWNDLRNASAGVGRFPNSGTKPDAVPNSGGMYEGPVAQAAGDGRASPRFPAGSSDGWCRARPRACQAR